MQLALLAFESLVNSVRCKTTELAQPTTGEFESLVNSVRCKTPITYEQSSMGLRALLIR